MLRLFQTSRDSGDRLAPKEPPRSAAEGETSDSRVEIDTGKTFQQIIGFGGAFTEAGADALSRMSAARRQEAINAYFHPETGSKYTLCRTHINSCDFALGNYAYNDTEGDYELKQFDISRDHQLLIPFIKDALKLSGRSFKLLASPWSPPAWMKTTGEMNNGGKLRDDCRDAWALYYAKYIEAYRKEGINIWAISVQNEPDAVQTWDSCLYSAEEERDFVKLHLGPTLVKEGLSDIRIVVWDHNKDIIEERASTILSDPEAAQYVWGVGFHWYTGDHFDQLARVYERFPDKALLFTEGCQEGGVRLRSWELGEKYGHAIIGDMNNGTVGWIDWNMVLDIGGGPNHVGNFCDAPIIADPETDTLHYQNAYYYIGHFSRFVRPGAVRVETTLHATDLEAVAFRNPDDSIVAVILNQSEDDRPFDLIIDGQICQALIPPRSMQTYRLVVG